MQSKRYILILSLSLCFFFIKGFSQDTTNILTGNVISAINGEPLAGIKITAPGEASVITADSGDFVLKISSYNITLKVEGIGYQTKQVPVKNNKNISIALNDETLTTLNDDIETINGNRTKIYTTQAIADYKNNYTETAESVDKLLQGKIAGLNVISRSGDPGIGANMFIRGFNTLNMNTQPLIVVDGVIYEDIYAEGSYIPGNIHGNALLNLEVKDIESVTVLKDATSIYGSKAANGVILINTIRPDKTVTQIDFYSRFGINYKPETLPVLSANDYTSYLTNQLQSSGLSFEEIANLPFLFPVAGSDDYYRYTNNTNWQDEIFTNSVEQDYYLKVVGGDEIVKMAVSVGYMNHKGIIKNDELEKYNMRLNTDVKVTNKLNIYANLSFTVSQKNLRGSGINNIYSPVYLALAKGPIFAPYINNERGTTPNLEDEDPLSISNPVAIVNEMTGDVQDKRFFGTIGFNYQIYKGISLEDIFNINFSEKREDYFMPDHGTVSSLLSDGIADNTVFNLIDRNYGLYNDFRFKYKLKENGYHNVMAMAGMRFSSTRVESDWGKAYNTPSDEVRNLDSGEDDLKRTGGNSGQWNDITFYSTADYNYMHKYFVTATLAMDGSSKFGSKADGVDLSGHKFGVFPAISAAWLLSSEKFMPSFNWLDIIKLRASFGITGNSDLGYYADKKYYNTERYIGVVGVVFTDIPNPYIQWEKVSKTNAGLDIALLDERIGLFADVFSNKTDNMLVYTPINIISGKNGIMSNEGSMSNKGYEVGFNARLINSKVKWDIGSAVSHYKNKVESLPIDYPDADNITLTMANAPIGQFYGYVTNGVYVSDAEAQATGLKNKLSTGELVDFRGGDVRFINLDDSENTNVIDENDRTVIGDPNPDFTGFVNSSVSYMGFTLDVLVTFSYGNDVYNAVRAKFESMSGFENQLASVSNMWRYDGQETDMPRAEYGDPMGNARISDRWVEDGSYVRLKNITLSYDIPVKTSYLRNAQAYISVNNLLTFTKYLGYDPEFSTSVFGSRQGIDYGLTPVFKSFNIGLKIGL